ncbi:hypothetical protein Lesp02_19700 [Lentzea sp. NBRC 105346]|uniref:hypothetical protein n=1 Tax=Lentzea sp. NBRC 105346 TaxID=3032205 RepID=UPI0024A3E128|nr:hypothetical protein [Lentzea sp. NBRC 105346]GLZ29780.1 hypothetical protein Lesp02_19700 [Lentzea sp. NBRC 105346]
MSLSREEILRARRKYTEQVVATVLFTVVVLWAVVATVVLINASGVLAVAAAIGLSAGLMYVYESWQNVRARGRELRALALTEDEPDSVGYTSALVRL